MATPLTHKNENKLNALNVSAGAIMTTASFFLGIELLYFFGGIGNSLASSTCARTLALTPLAGAVFCCLLVSNKIAIGIANENDDSFKNIRGMLTFAVWALIFSIFCLAVVMAFGKPKEKDSSLYDCNITYEGEDKSQAKMKCVVSPSRN